MYECFIIRQPVNLFTKNDTTVNFSQKNDNSVKKSVIKFVKIPVKFSVSLQRKNTRASSFYHCFTILRLRKRGILFLIKHNFVIR